MISEQIVPVSSIVKGVVELMGASLLLKRLCGSQHLKNLNRYGVYQTGYSEYRLIPRHLSTFPPSWICDNNSHGWYGIVGRLSNFKRTSQGPDALWLVGRTAHLSDRRDGVARSALPRPTTPRNHLLRGRLILSPAAASGEFAWCFPEQFWHDCSDRARPAAGGLQTKLAPFDHHWAMAQSRRPWRGIATPTLDDPCVLYTGISHQRAKQKLNERSRAVNGRSTPFSTKARVRGGVRGAVCEIFLCEARSARYDRDG